jgi:acetoin utilization protein AcuB
MLAAPRILRRKKRLDPGQPRNFCAGTQRPRRLPEALRVDWPHGAPSAKFQKGRKEDTMPGERVVDRMVRNPTTVLETDALRLAVDISVRQRIRHLPVLGAGGELVGVLTDRDIKRALPSAAQQLAAEEYERILDEVTVGRVMTRAPLSVAPTVPLAEVVRLMVERRIGGVPVVHQGKVVGIITKTDVLRAFLERLEPPGQAR